MLATYLNPCFLQGLKPWRRREGSGCTSFVYTSLDRQWVGRNPSVLALSEKWEKGEAQYVKGTTSRCDLVSVCLPTCGKNTVEDGGHGDNTVGAASSSVKGAAFSVQGYSTCKRSRAPVLSPDPASCRLGGACQSKSGSDWGLLPNVKSRDLGPVNLKRSEKCAEFNRDW